MAKNRRNFTDIEKDFIKSTYSSLSNKEISNVLGRTVGVIKAFANIHNLKKNPKVEIGQIFGKLKICKELKSKNKDKSWLCRCECGKLSKCTTNTLTSGHSKSCGCERIKSISTGYGAISGTLFGTIKKNAKIRGLQFNLTIQDLNDLFNKQQGKCALTKLDLQIDKIKINGKKITTASLDRIDSSKNYTIDNIQWVHKDINYMKLDYDQNYFIKMCELVTKTQREKHGDSNR